MKRKNIILFGPPGSGKGTQAKKLIDKYNLLHISTGDLFRYEIGHNTPLGQEAKSYMSKGELVPNSVTIGMLENKVKQNPDVQGYIFDGYPRNVEQAEALDRILADHDTEVYKLISLEVNEDEIVSRILERGKTSGRVDDLDEDIIRNRIKVYESETAPVYSYYDEQSKSVLVPGIGHVDEIFSRIATHL